MTNVFVFLRRTSDKYKTRRQYKITSIRRYKQNVYAATHQYDRTTYILITIRHIAPRRQNICRRSYLLPKKRTNIKPSSPCHLRRCKNKRHAKSRSFDSILSVSSHDIGNGQTIIQNREGIIAATQKTKKERGARAVFLPFVRRIASAAFAACDRRKLFNIPPASAPNESVRRAAVFFSETNISRRDMPFLSRHSLRAPYRCR